MVSRSDQFCQERCKLFTFAQSSERDNSKFLNRNFRAKLDLCFFLNESKKGTLWLSCVNPDFRIVDFRSNSQKYVSFFAESKDSKIFPFK